MVRKIQENLRVIESSKTIFLLLAVLIAGAALPGAVFACDVTSVSFYLGRTQAIAESHNTSTVYIASGDSFWFHVHWGADTPDDQGFDLVIYDYSTSETLTTRSITSPTQRTYTGSTSLQTYSFVPHTIKAKVRRKPSGDWFWSSGRTLTVVKVDKLQYYDNYTSSYIDMPNPLYIIKGRSVGLKAVKNPSSASWPSGKPVWGGTAGLSGTGEQKVLNISTVSSSSTDYKTVTVECGNTITGNVIVYDFAGVLTPQDNFSLRSQISYGIEENVNGTSIMNPSDLTPTQVGGLKWYKYSGVGSVSGGSDGNGTYDAEESAGDVNLFLRVESGPHRAYNKDYFKAVVLPNGTRMTRYSSRVKHLQWSASAGIGLWYWLDPKSVSFSNLDFGEDSCPATGKTGIYNTVPPGNHAQNTFTVILGGNRTTGCLVYNYDGPYTQRNPWGNGGTYTWSIPTQYIDDTSTRHTFGSNCIHSPTLQANGDATMTKGGQPGFAALNAQTSDY